jgi:hypothetical protein
MPLRTLYIMVLISDVFWGVFGKCDYRLLDLSCLSVHKEHSPSIRKMINSLNAELIPMYHLLILLGGLTFMGPCIVSISNKMQRYTVYLYLETALHNSGGITTHHQERIQLYLKHLVFVTSLLLSAAIVEELEPVWVCYGWRTPPIAHWTRI